jgi:hypothetical protein
LCYWAGKAGMQGLVNDYGLRPGLQTGKYQAHLSKRMGFDEQNKSLYALELPGQTRVDMARSNMTVYVQPPHELAEREIHGNPAAVVRMQELVDHGDMPPSYREHPVVQGTVDLVMAWGLYLDGVPYSQVDSVLGVWLFNIATGARHLCALVRKRAACKCGCRGGCTYWGLMHLATLVPKSYG